MVKPKQKICEDQSSLFFSKQFFSSSNKIMNYTILQSKIVYYYGENSIELISYIVKYLLYPSAVMLEYVFVMYQICLTNVTVFRKIY